MPNQHPNHDAQRIAEAFDRCTQAAQQGEVAYLRLHTHIHVDDMPGPTDDERLAQALELANQQEDWFPAIVLGQATYTLPTVPVAHPDIVDRIDGALAYMTDAQTGPGDTDWPFRSF